MSKAATQEPVAGREGLDFETLEERCLPRGSKTLGPLKARSIHLRIDVAVPEAMGHHGAREHRLGGRGRALKPRRELRHVKQDGHSSMHGFDLRSTLDRENRHMTQNMKRGTQEKTRVLVPSFCGQREKVRLLGALSSCPLIIG